MSKFKYSIICCYYNEINILNKKFHNFIEETKKLPFSFEVFICDNNSKDGTREFLKKIELKKMSQFNFLFNDTNIGKGGSIKKCAALSKGEYILIFDIDEYLIRDLIKIAISNAPKRVFKFSKIILKNLFFFILKLLQRQQHSYLRLLKIKIF